MKKGKTLVIGDIHGLDTWKSAIAQNKADKVIFMGDYFDSFDIESSVQISNFMDIIEYKKANMDSCILLIGNHDFHYIYDESYSGYQHKQAYTIGLLIKRNIEYLQFSYYDEYNDILFTHAGVSNTWLNRCKIDAEQEKHLISEDINKLPLKAFRFQGGDPYGDSPFSGPLWIRGYSLDHDQLPVFQIVGHTVQHMGIKINQYEDFIIVDSLFNKECLLIDEEFKIIKID